MSRDGSISARGVAMVVRWIAASFVVSLLVAGEGRAAPQQNLDSRSLEIWRQGDACVADSIKQFPDHDLASLQKRDRSVDACLAAGDLPPRAHLVPDP